MATIPITKRGAEKLKDELHKLKTIDRPAVINAIAEARAQGDLSENAEYDAAKDRQGFIEGRIQEIEGMGRLDAIIIGWKRQSLVGLRQEPLALGFIRLKQLHQHRDIALFKIVP